MNNRTKKKQNTRKKKNKSLPSLLFELNKALSSNRQLDVFTYKRIVQWTFICLIIFWVKQSLCILFLFYFILFFYRFGCKQNLELACNTKQERRNEKQIGVLWSSSSIGLVVQSLFMFAIFNFMERQWREKKKYKLTTAHSIFTRKQIKWITKKKIVGKKHTYERKERNE